MTAIQGRRVGFADTSERDTALPSAPPHGRFATFVARAKESRKLVVQPRMGFGPIAQMRAGLEAVRSADATAVGTVTLDSYTRVNDHASARRAIDSGAELNGFPLVAHGHEATRTMLEGIAGDDFPVQVRHGSAKPYALFEAMATAGVDATEGGPVSYCLPYSRAPLSEAVAEWARCSDLVAEQTARGKTIHLESFGGCMLGQLCPPSLLVALSILEGLFFRQHGVTSISLSYAQQTHVDQDAEAIAALRRLASERLSDVNWHVVIYTYMGMFPRTTLGAYRILEESVRLAVRSGAERLIVKTVAEAHRIPTVAENVNALEFADAVAKGEFEQGASATASNTDLYEEAKLLIDSTLELAGSAGDVGEALIRAFAKGYLDVPFCLHHDNANLSRAFIDHRGHLSWSEPGRMPLHMKRRENARRISSRELLSLLSYNQRRFDREQFAGSTLRRVV